MEEEKGELDVSSLDVFNKKPSFPFIKVDDPGFTFKAYIDPMDTPILSPYTPLKKDISHQTQLFNYDKESLLSNILINERYSHSKFLMYRGKFGLELSGDELTLMGSVEDEYIKNVMEDARILEIDLKKYHTQLFKLSGYVNDIINRIHTANFNDDDKNIHNFSIPSNSLLINIKLLANMHWVIMNTVIEKMIDKFNNGANIYITSLFETVLNDLLSKDCKIDGKDFYGLDNETKKILFSRDAKFNHDIDLIIIGYARQFMMYHKPINVVAPAFFMLEKSQQFFTKGVLSSVISVLILILVVAFIVIGTSKFISMMKNKRCEKMSVHDIRFNKR